MGNIMFWMVYVMVQHNLRTVHQRSEFIYTVPCMVGFRKEKKKLSRRRNKLVICRLKCIQCNIMVKTLRAVQRVKMDKRLYVTDFGFKAMEWNTFYWRCCLDFWIINCKTWYLYILIKYQQISDKTFTRLSTSHHCTNRKLGCSLVVQKCKTNYPQTESIL